MRVRSFIEDLDQLEPVEVEMTLWPGVPEIVFLGLPDQHVRESAKRIKSAIRAQGFQFPVAQQILVNLKPSHVKKSSRGLELAVAACYLWLTEQVKRPEIAAESEMFIYGELSLLGEVSFPAESSYPLQKNQFLLTGASGQGLPKFFRRDVISHLRDLAMPQTIAAAVESEAILESASFKRLMDFFVSPRLARILEVAAWGEHSILLAGPAGMGKTTLARMIHAFLPPRAQGEGHRPFVKPHPSTPLISLLGGQRRGELSQAHGGVLCLDEFLEFKTEILDALREPLQDGFLRVARLGRVHVHPAQFQLIATTNLCPCGEFIPGGIGTKGGSQMRCRFSLTRCRSYAQRFSGPLLDRFAIVTFVTAAGENTISVRDVFERLRSRKVARTEKPPHVPNQLRSASEIESQIPAYFQTNPEAWTSNSLRRKESTLRVARTLADLDDSEKVCARHLKEALDFTVHPFRRMQDWDLIR